MIPPNTEARKLPGNVVEFRLVVGPLRSLIVRVFPEGRIMFWVNDYGDIYPASLSLAEISDYLTAAAGLREGGTMG